MEKTGHRQTTRSGESFERARRARRCIGELLLELGVAPHTEGYCALLNGTMLLTEQKEMRLRLSSTLYPIIERFTGHAQSQAEHAIRDTVRMSFTKPPSALRRTLFPEGQTPTNAEMLYELAAYAQRRLREERR